MDGEIIRQLADPSRFPGGVGEVTQYQTHLSLVCLVGERVYKLKKALRLPFVDFSSIEKRREVCEEEVRLNSRLCPDIYLGVVPLFSISGEVNFNCEAGAEIIDYAVLMRRLPAARMMDVLLARDEVTLSDVEGIARAVERFHRGVASPGDAAGAIRSADRLRDFTLANFDETASFCGAIFDPDLHRKLRTLAERDLEEFSPILRRRARDGRVVDGHGDLHARNICLCEPMAIYDCLEFNRELRIGDVASENAFLIMDLCYRGHDGLGMTYLDRYIALSGDEEQRVLMPMLLRYRAMVRAKVAAITSAGPEIARKDHDGCLRSARRHLNLMAGSAIDQGPPWLICACGLPASGKSFVFGAIAESTGWPCFTSDHIRKELAGIAQDERAPESCYSDEVSERTYAEVLDRASSSLRSGSVLVDANFARASLRRRAFECAQREGARFAIVWFEADEHEISARMDQRVMGAGHVSDANIDVYLKLRAVFEPPGAGEADKLVHVHAAGPSEQGVAAILQRLMSDR